jgi:hypothetical protein
MISYKMSQSEHH